MSWPPRWTAPHWKDPKGTTTKQCLQCGGPVKRAAAKLCSQRCRGQWLKKPQKTCSVCGVRPCSRQNKYCSAKCAYQGRKAKRRPERPCPVCRTSFWPTLQPSGKWERYCSRRCYLAHVGERRAMLEAHCLQCGHSFRRTKASLGRNRLHFCSRKCSSQYQSGVQHPNYRGARDPNRGPLWERIAETIRVRDERKCRKCGLAEAENRGKRLSVDHIRAWRTFTDKVAANAPENLVSLCQSCHNKKTLVTERKYLRGDVQAFEQYRRDIGVK